MMMLQTDTHYALLSMLFLLADSPTKAQYQPALPQAPEGNTQLTLPQTHEGKNQYHWTLSQAHQSKNQYQPALPQAPEGKNQYHSAQAPESASIAMGTWR